MRGQFRASVVRSLNRHTGYETSATDQRLSLRLRRKDQLTNLLNIGEANFTPKGVAPNGAFLL